jgi:hypothetical protein
MIFHCLVVVAKPVAISKLYACEHAMHAEGARQHKIQQRKGGVLDFRRLQEDGIYPTCKMTIIHYLLYKIC